MQYVFIMEQPALASVTPDYAYTFAAIFYFQIGAFHIHTRRFFVYEYGLCLLLTSYTAWCSYIKFVCMHMCVVCIDLQAKADTVDSLEKYRFSCKPCFLYYAVSLFCIYTLLSFTSCGVDLLKRFGNGLYLCVFNSIDNFFCYIEV